MPLDDLLTNDIPVDSASCNAGSHHQMTDTSGLLHTEKLMSILEHEMQQAITRGSELLFIRKPCFDAEDEDLTLLSSFKERCRD